MTTPGLPPPPIRIIVADDETQICRLIRDVLKSGGYQIDLTRDGDELLMKYHTGGYALIILDTQLNRISGMEVVMKLRDRGDAVPIILLSTPSGAADRVEPFAFTYRVDVLRKPFGVGDLRAAVRRSLKADNPD